MVVSGMEAALDLARRHWDDQCRAIEAGSAVVGFELVVTPTTSLIVGAEAIRVVREPNTVLLHTAGVRPGTAAEVCMAAASALVDFWHRLADAVDQGSAGADVTAILGEELLAEAGGGSIDPQLLRMVVQLQRERALAFQRAVWGEDPLPIDPYRPAAGEAVVVGEPDPSARGAFFLDLPEDGAADPTWQLAARVGERVGRAWRRDNAPGSDQGVEDLVEAHMRTAMPLPKRRWTIAAWVSLVIVPAGVIGIAFAVSSIAGTQGGRMGVALVIGITLLALLATLIVLLFRAALADHRFHRDRRRWATRVAIHRAHEAARTWRTSEVRWSVPKPE